MLCKEKCGVTGMGAHVLLCPLFSASQNYQWFPLIAGLFVLHPVKLFAIHFQPGEVTQR